jgi:ABC-type lipoprotein export system ATPase subunit
MAMLEMSELIKTYRTDMVATKALDDFSLVVEEGEFVAVSGPSGSGKTTFLNVAGLLDTFDGGRYHLDGEDVSGLSDRAQSRIRNRKIGFIFQSFNLIPDLNVYDNVDVPLRYRGQTAAERRAAIEKTLEWVRRSFPEASSSGWPSPAPWPESHGSSSPTSPPATSTRPPPARSWSSWSRSMRWAQPSSW